MQEGDNDTLLNIEAVENWICCIPKKLAFGCSPKSKFFKDYFGGDFKTHGHIIDLKKTQSWYYKKHVEKTSCKYTLIPLEEHRVSREDYEESNDDSVFRICKKIAAMIESAPDETRFFIHGGKQCNGFAFVIAMIVWYLYDNKESDPVTTLHREVFKNAEHITCDFANDSPQAQQIKRIIAENTKGIRRFTFKKVKTEK